MHQRYVKNLRNYNIQICPEKLLAEKVKEAHEDTVELGSMSSFWLIERMSSF